MFVSDSCSLWANCLTFQIDCDVICEMTDDQMAGIGITKFGDRLAIKSFCQQRASHASQHQHPSRQELANRIREKAADSRNKRLGLSGNKNAKKSCRLIEVGWLHFDGKVFRQQRAKHGGGTRQLKVELTTTMQELMNECKKLFFPQGESHQLSLNEVNCTMKLFDQTDLNLHDTVDALLKATCVPHLRFYLATKLKEQSLQAGGGDSNSDSEGLSHCHQCSSCKL